ncbi:MAG: CorA family divalent cation transporter [Solirubrobacterales bacterium]|nr:CorA family divalent cation transporter [Solirubrobacterales bacterium]
MSGMREKSERDRTLTRFDWPADDPSLVWFDLTGTELTPDELFRELGPHCPGITAPMIGDVITPDERPTEVSFEGGDVKLASTFAVHSVNPTRREKRGEPVPAGLLVIQPVELLAGASWLVTCWHPTRTYYGNQRQDGDGPAEGPEAIRRAVESRWTESSGRTAGDLGVLVMDELALTYAPAYRAIATWLEDWELGFYVRDERFTDLDLANLWGARALLRDWLTPLDPPGITTSPVRAWLPGVDRDLVVGLDRRIDRALSALDRLGDSLRSSFSLLHVQQSERAREATESLERRVEIAAAALLVPTLIVGFYGANTWVPGEGERWGFWVMVAALVTFTALVVTFLVLWQRKQAKETRREREEEERVRLEVLRGP